MPDVPEQPPSQSHRYGLRSASKPARPKPASAASEGPSLQEEAAAWELEKRRRRNSRDEDRPGPGSGAGRPAVGEMPGWSSTRDGREEEDEEYAGSGMEGSVREGLSRKPGVAKAKAGKSTSIDDWLSPPPKWVNARHKEPAAVRKLTTTAPLEDEQASHREEDLEDELEEEEEEEEEYAEEQVSAEVSPVERQAAERKRKKDEAWAEMALSAR